jgi:salicylate hydroxylase
VGILLEQVGAGIQIAPNATSILQRWGILDTARSYAVQPRQMNIHSYQDSKAIVSIGMAAEIEETYCAPYLMIHRKDIHNILYTRAKELGAVINFGCNITPSSIDINKPEIELDTGETFRADVVIGADGQISNCRTLLLGKEATPIDTGDVVFRGTVEAVTLREHPELVHFLNHPDFNFWMGPDSHIVSYLTTQDDLLNLVITASRQPGEPLVLKATEVKTEEIKHRFREWEPRILKLLSLVSSYKRWPLLQVQHAPSWFHPSCKLLLIGDAAHSILPYL